MSRYLGPAIALAIACAVSGGPATAQTALSGDARCFVISVSIAQSELKKKRDPKLYDNTAMFFMGRLDANQELVPDVDLESIVSTMTREEFVAAAKQCVEEVGAAMDRAGRDPAKGPD